jgi:hypothetical protein
MTIRTFLFITKKRVINLLPRIYRDATDLHKMCTLLQTGCTAQTNAYHIHSGELILCLFTWLDGYDPWQHIYIWEDTADPKRMLGWAMLSTPWSAFDSFTNSIAIFWLRPYMPGASIRLSVRLIDAWRPFAPSGPML